MEFENAVRRTHEVTVAFTAAPETVFPLLCPVREYDWIEDWNCVMVFSASGIAEVGCVFRTNRGDGDEIWTVSRYEPGQAIGFVRVVANVWVVTMDIELSPSKDGTTAARWRHTYTALSRAGAAIIEQMDPARHAAHVHELATLANHYLTTGTMLRSTSTEHSTSTEYRPAAT